MYFNVVTVSKKLFLFCHQLLYLVSEKHLILLVIAMHGATFNLTQREFATTWAVAAATPTRCSGFAFAVALATYLHIRKLFVQALDTLMCVCTHLV